MEKLQKIITKILLTREIAISRKNDNGQKHHRKALLKEEEFFDEAS